MLSTLLEAARPDQRFPALGESASLLLGGLRARALLAASQSPRRLWADGLQLGVLLIVLVVAVAARDPRPTIGAAVYLAPGLVYAVDETISAGPPSNIASGYWALSAALLVALAAAAWRIRRQQRTPPHR